MPIVRDLKRRDSKKILILNKEEKIEPVSKTTNRKILDVKAKNGQNDYVIFSAVSENKEHEKNAHK